MPTRSTACSKGTPGGDHVELTDKIGVMRGLVEGQIKLDAWKDKLMQDPTRLVEAYQASALGQEDWSGGSSGRKR